MVRIFALIVAALLFSLPAIAEPGDDEYRALTALCTNTTSAYLKSIPRSQWPKCEPSGSTSHSVETDTKLRDMQRQIDDLKIDAQGQLIDDAIRDQHELFRK